MEQPRQLNIDEDGLLEPCVQFEMYDYFTGSEVSFAMTYVVAFACIPCKQYISTFYLTYRTKTETNKITTTNRETK